MMIRGSNGELEGRPIKLEKKFHVHNMDKSISPAIRVDSGTRLLIETDDALSGQITRETVIAAKGHRPAINTAEANPATGPIFIEGARPGDKLIVHVLGIALDKVGFCSVSKGALGGICQEDVVWIADLDTGYARLPNGKEVVVSPMIGVIGVAPAGAPVWCQLPGDHGGNMDCNLVRVGAELVLPVHVEGGLLALGDVHALMGDGEVTGMGIETGAEIEIEVKVDGKHETGRPYLFVDQTICTIASADTYEEAAWLAVKDMVTLVSLRTGLGKEEAYLLIGMCGHVRVCQLVNPLKTARVELPIDIL